MEQVKRTYEAPVIEVIEISLEAGFAASLNVNETGTGNTADPMETGEW